MGTDYKGTKVCSFCFVTSCGNASRGKSEKCKGTSFPQEENGQL